MASAIRNRRKANRARRLLAWEKQTTVLVYDPVSRSTIRVDDTPELEKNRAAANAEAYRRRYPTAPTYKDTEAGPDMSRKPQSCRRWWEAETVGNVNRSKTLPL